MPHPVHPIAALLSLVMLTGPVAAGSHDASAAGAAAAADDQRPQLLMPIMNAARGRRLFAEKGCVVCHSVNGVGGEDAPALDLAWYSGPVDPFDFAARMWRGAPAMIAMQQMELGGQIELTGEELADIIAFAYSRNEQQKFSADDIPDRIREIIAEGEHEEGE